MKLFYFPGACSLAPHILIRELGLAADIEAVDLQSKKTASGLDFLSINPKGYVPALQLDSGEVLTEGVAILSYLTNLKPDFGPTLGSLEWFRQLEWLTFLSSEIHKGIGSLFAASSPEEKTRGFEKVKPRLAFLNQLLSGQDYLQGTSFTTPDAYLFTTLSWTDYLQLDLSPYPGLVSYLKRVGERPGVVAAQQAEKALSPA